jgi:hypothetical protein
MPVVASCTGSNPPVVPDPSAFIVLRTGSIIGVSAVTGSADAGSNVSISSGGTGNGTAAADGSVAFKGTLGDGPLTLSYTKLGQPLVSELTVAQLDSLVSTPLFSTGSAPNDMEFSQSGLVVANSLDNTVVRYGLDGTVLQTASFPQFASPSYLGLSGEELAVVRNGDNVISLHDINTLQPLAGREHTLVDTGVAFIGPGKPYFSGGYLLQPRAQLASFSPTSYGAGLFSQIVFSSTTGALQLDIPTSGVNVATAQVVFPATGDPYVLAISAGDQQFDEDFHPFMVSDSFLDVYRLPEGTGNPVLDHTYNLGKIGATGLEVKDGTVAYMGSIVSGDIFALDFTNPTAQPTKIHLTDEFTYISDIQLLVGGNLLATSFNTDELYVIDTATNIVSPAPYPGPFQVSPDPDMLAGAISVEVDAAGNAYVLLSIANAIAKVDLLP